MNKLTLIFFATAMLFAAGAPATFTGVITDSMCGANHQPMNVTPEAKCVLECVKASHSVKFVLYDGKKSYVLSDQQTPAKFAAQKVKVTGALDSAGAIQVTKIEAAR